MIANRINRRKLNIKSLSTILTLVGLTITIAFIIIAFSAPLLQSLNIIQDPLESLANPIHVPPNSEYLFGTSSQGYDVFSRTLFGSQAADENLL